MIPDDLRRDLVARLMDVPLVGLDDNDKGRTALLAGIPGAVYFSRNAGNSRGDVMLLVLQSEEAFGPKGEWRLLKIIDNALDTVEGTELGLELRAIRQQLLRLVEEDIQPVKLHPADVAAVHLFDLRQPVLMCLGQLPIEAGTTGFVVNTPTPRLLAYFCDSVKQRGAGYGTWSRNDVATTGPPLVIDPKHTTAAVVLSKIDKVRSLLAKKHVLWSMYLEDAAEADAVWGDLATAFSDTLDHHLVITFGMPADTPVPASMVLLPAPKFTSRDISNWVREIGTTLAWRDSVVEQWASVILVDYAGNPHDWPIELVYERLEYHRDLVTHHRTSDELLGALRDLQLIGE
ncbi:hypothetical protein ACFTZB_07655 [Rhodococcus sp. NPDC057014]|uniref:hypothetical protein n=1 Tax=Rhodococcus sp. NPDC057014 TaxID=3346000 RepID=UPI00363BAF2C